MDTVWNLLFVHDVLKLNDDGLGMDCFPLVLRAPGPFPFRVLNNSFWGNSLHYYFADFSFPFSLPFVSGTNVIYMLGFLDRYSFLYFDPFLLFSSAFWED